MGTVANRPVYTNWVMFQRPGLPSAALESVAIMALNSDVESINIKGGILAKQGGTLMSNKRLPSDGSY